MVGVCSDELVKSFKASPVLTSAERYESVGNCRWLVMRGSQPGHSQPFSC